MRILVVVYIGIPRYSTAATATPSTSSITMAPSSTPYGIVLTHAWVFPGEFAVCWNGLVYRVKSVGAVADLEADVQAIVSTKPWSDETGMYARDPFFCRPKGNM